MTVTQYLFKFDSETITASIHRSKRIRTSEIIVDEDSVEIRTPMNKPMAEIENLVRKKKNWIVKKQREYRNREPHISKPNYKENSTLPYLGKNVPIRIENKGESNEGIDFIGGEFIVSLSSNTPVEIRKFYEEWLKTTAHNIFLVKVKQYARLINVDVKKIAIKDMKGRWAAVTKFGGINLNTNLIKAPEEVIDYIIIHELCHFIIKGHSHSFWELVRSYFPRYEDSIKWLDVNSRAMI